MKEQWKTAAVGGLIGATLALVVVFTAGGLGFLPGTSDARIHAYLVAHPDLLVEMTDKLQQQEEAKDQVRRQTAVDKIGLSKFFSPAVAYVTGPKNAKKTLVEFFDYDCPYCRASLPAVEKYYDAHKNDVRFAFVEFPIKGQLSTMAAHVAVAARMQPDKYVAFHFALMGSKEFDEQAIYAAAKTAGLDIPKLMADMKDPSVDRQVAASLRLGQEAGIDGTPTFIIDGEVHPGMVDEKSLKQMTQG